MGDVILSDKIKDDFCGLIIFLFNFYEKGGPMKNHYKIIMLGMLLVTVGPAFSAEQQEAKGVYSEEWLAQEIDDLVDRVIELDLLPDNPENKISKMRLMAIRSSYVRLLAEEQRSSKDLSSGRNSSSLGTSTCDSSRRSVSFSPNNKIFTIPSREISAMAPASIIAPLPLFAFTQKFSASTIASRETTAASLPLLVSASRAGAISAPTVAASTRRHSSPLVSELLPSIGKVGGVLGKPAAFIGSVATPVATRRAIPAVPSETTGALTPPIRPLLVRPLPIKTPSKP